MARAKQAMTLPHDLEIANEAAAFARSSKVGRCFKMSPSRRNRGTNVDEADAGIPAGTALV